MKKPIPYIYKIYTVVLEYYLKYTDIAIFPAPSAESDAGGPGALGFSLR